MADGGQPQAANFTLMHPSGNAVTKTGKDHKPPHTNHQQSTTNHHKPPTYHYNLSANKLFEILFVDGGRPQAANFTLMHLLGNVVTKTGNDHKPPQTTRRRLQITTNHQHTTIIYQQTNCLKYCLLMVAGHKRLTLR